MAKRILSANSPEMYERLGELQQELVPKGDYAIHCFRHKKKWSPVEFQQLRHAIRNIWDIDALRKVCYFMGRSPYSIFNTYVNLIYR